MPAHKQYVTGPEGRPPTYEEALAMGYALFDGIEGDRLLREALGEEDDRGSDGGRDDSR